MNVKRAMHIDRLLGYPLSTLLWAVSGVLKCIPVKGKRLDGAPERILIIKPFGFGSILEMYPLVHTLRDAWPNAEITLFTFSQNRDLARLLSLIDRVACVPFGGGLLSFGAATLAMTRQLRAWRPDVILDCEFYSFYCSLLTRFCAHEKTVTIGFTRNQPIQEWVFHHTVAVDLSRHISNLFNRMAMPLGLEDKPVLLDTLSVRPPAEAVATVEKILGETGTDATRIAVNINASPMCLNRRWPAEYYADLIEMLLDDATLSPPAQFYLVGGPDDIEYVGKFERCLNRDAVRNVTGELAISETAALLQRMDLFIGNDSGPLHLALACGVPTVSFFGPETPALYGPLGSKHTVFYQPPPCSPCLNIFFSKDNKCNDNICLKRLSAGTVCPDIRTKLSEILESKR